MRIAMYYANNDLRIEEAARPAAGPGEVLMRVEASGICGSDVMEWYRIGRVPLVLGHEVAGVVEEVGEGTAGFRRGERIVAAHHVSCGVCRYCVKGSETVCETLRKTNFYPGGFAEFLRLPPINVEKGVFRIPSNVSFEEATFVEPLACVLRGQRRAGVVEGDSVLVIGSGISGILHVNLARARKAGKVIATDTAPARREMAKRFGADEAIDASLDVPSRVRALTDGLGADAVILTAGAPQAVEQAIRSVRRGGTILFFAASPQGAAIDTPVNDIFWRTEVTLLGSYAGSTADHKEAMALIASGAVTVKEMVTHRLPLAEIEKGFALVAEGGDSLKVIIEPQK